MFKNRKQPVFWCVSSPLCHDARQSESNHAINVPMANNVMSQFGGQDILFIQPLSSSTLSMTDTWGTAGGHQCRCGHLYICALGLESVYMCVPPLMNMFFLMCVLSIWVYGCFDSPSLCASYWFSSTQPLSVKHMVSNNPALHLISVTHTHTHVRTHAHTHALCPPLPRQTPSGTQPNVSFLCFHSLTHTRTLCTC